MLITGLGPRVDPVGGFSVLASGFRQRALRRVRFRTGPAGFGVLGYGFRV